MKKNIIILGLLLLNIFTGVIYLNTSKENEELKKQNTLLTPSDKIILDDKADKNCLTQETIYEVSGQSMQPLIKDGSKIKGISNFYNCNKTISRGDIAVIDIGYNQNPIIKTIKVIPGDVVKFENRNMYVNGNKLVNSVGNAYNFDDKEINLMSAYMQDGVLQEGSYLFFGDNVVESKDSRKIGAFGIDSFKAKIVLE